MRNVKTITILSLLFLAATQSFADERKAVDFTFKDINPASATHGEEVTLSESYADGGVVLNFLASWCGYCWKELPHLQKMSAAGEAKVVGVAADEYGAPAEMVLSLVESHELTIPILWVDVETAKAPELDYSHQMLPATYLIDGEGTIVKMLEGAVKPEQLRDEVTRAFK